LQVQGYLGELFLQFFGENFNGFLFAIGVVVWVNWHSEYEIGYFVFFHEPPELLPEALFAQIYGFPWEGYSNRATGIGYSRSPLSVIYGKVIFGGTLSCHEWKVEIFYILHTKF
jgi:hypothetical protein